MTIKKNTLKQNRMLMIGWRKNKVAKRDKHYEEGGDCGEQLGRMQQAKIKQKEKRKRGVWNIDETEKRVRSKCMYYKRMKTDTKIYIYKRRSDKRSGKDGADRVNK